MVDYVMPQRRRGQVLHARDVREPAGVAQQLPEADHRPEVLHLGHIITNRRVQIHVAVCHQDHGHCRREALGDRADGKGGIPCDAPASPEFEVADFTGSCLTFVVDGQLGTWHPVLACQERQRWQLQGKGGRRSAFLAQKPDH